MELTKESENDSQYNQNSSQNQPYSCVVAPVMLQNITFLTHSLGILNAERQIRRKVVEREVEFISRVVEKRLEFITDFLTGFVLDVMHCVIDVVDNSASLGPGDDQHGCQAQCNLEEPGRAGRRE